MDMTTLVISLSDVELIVGSPSSGVENDSLVFKLRGHRRMVWRSSGSRLQAQISKNVDASEAAGHVL
jgi:hypothetical protein